MDWDLSHYKAVISYRRFSSKRQAKGASEARQQGMAAEWAQQHGITLSPLSATDAGLSGFHGKNLEVGALGKLLEAVEAGAVQTPALLLLEAADRFGRRPPIEALQTIFGRCLKNGLDLLLLDRSLLVTSDAVNNDISVLIRLALEIDAAHRYSDRLSRRMLNAHEHGRIRIKAGEAARPGWAPSWIDLIDGEWRLNAYATVIRRLLELLRSNGYNGTAKRLNEEGLLSPRGKQWTAGSITHVVQSVAIAGGRPTRRRDAAEVVWDYFPALLDRSDWEALLRRIENRGDNACKGPQREINYIGQAISHCVCGRPVGARVASYKTRDGDRIIKRYTRCRGRGDGTCKQPALPLNTVQWHLLSRLTMADMARLFPRQTGDQISQLQAEAGQLQRLIEQQQAKAANGRTAIEQLTDDTAALVVVAKAVTAADAEAGRLGIELRTVRQQLQALQGDARQQLGHQVVERVERLLGAFAAEQDTPEQRRELNLMLRELGLRITVDAEAERVGMAIADGQTIWQPVSKISSAIALASGASEHTGPAAFFRDDEGRVAITWPDANTHQP